MIDKHKKWQDLKNNPNREDFLRNFNVINDAINRFKREGELREKLDLKADDISIRKKI